MPPLARRKEEERRKEGAARGDEHWDKVAGQQWTGKLLPALQEFLSEKIKEKAKIAKGRRAARDA